MNPFIVLAYIASFAMSVANAADAWTTYVGVFKKKIAVEKNPSWFTKSPSRLLVSALLGASVPALLFVAVSLIGADSVPAWTMLIWAGVHGTIAVRHAIAAVKNAKINGGIV
jgi:hypothetical protein